MEARVMGDDSRWAEVMGKMVFFSLLMISLPISLYFTSKAVLFEGLFKMSSSDSYFYAAIVAVFSVHVVLAMFIYVAIKEDQKKPTKID